jgi:AraC-like DNA-binding protein
VQIIRVVGAAYSLLCLLFLGFRFRRFAATQLFGYVALVFYLFLRAFLKESGSPLYPYLAAIRPIIFLGPYFVWSATIALLGQRPDPRVRRALQFAVVAIACVDIAYVQSHPRSTAFYVLDFLAPVAPLVSAGFAFHAVRRFATIRNDAFPNRSAAPVVWLTAFTVANLFLSSCFLVDSFLELRGLVFQDVGPCLTAAALLGFIGYALKHGCQLFDENVVRTVQTIDGAPEMALAAETSRRIRDKLLPLFREQQVYLDPDLSIESVADRIEESPSDISRFLRHTEGQSFKSYLNEQRIRHCLAELRRPGQNKSILELAFAAGFNSKATFYRQFAKVVGCSPKDYRTTTVVTATHARTKSG